MSFATYLSCLWPGLPELWYRGQPRGVVAAAAFAILLNILLVTRFIYPEWLAPLATRLAGWVLVAIWLSLAVRAARRLPELLTPRAVATVPDRFEEAQDAFLRGRWFEAEAALESCLAVEPRDPPALLLMATVYRKTDRLVEATELLAQLTTLEAADRWRLELAAERSRLERETAPEETEAENAEEDEAEAAAEDEAADPEERASDSAERDRDAELAAEPGGAPPSAA